MPAARSKTNIQRTLLILLGILLAGLLTLNAKTLYSAEGFNGSNSVSAEKVLPTKVAVEKFYSEAFKSFVKKISSLK